MINITPLGNKVLVKPLPKKERTTGGLIIPAVIQQDLEEGEVIAIASNVINIKVGDKVLYSSRSGVAMLHDNETHYKFLSGPSEKDPGEIIAIL